MDVAFFMAVLEDKYGPAEQLDILRDLESELEQQKTAVLHEGIEAGKRQGKALFDLNFLSGDQQIITKDLLSTGAKMGISKHIFTLISEELRMVREKIDALEEKIVFPDYGD